MYTIGFDFKDTWLDLDKLSFSIRFFTERNVYTPHPYHTKIQSTENGINLLSTRLAWAGCQQLSEGSIELSVIREKRRYIVKGKAFHPKEICKSILIQVAGIDVRTIQFDEESKERINERGEIRAKRYPASSRDLRVKMPLIFAGNDRGEEWYALSKDDKLRAKRFACHYDPFVGLQILDLAHEEDKRYRGHHIELPEWHIGLVNNKEDIVLERCRDLEQNFGLVPYDQRKDTPKWLDDIRLIVNLHGEHWTGHIFNTFADMERALEWVTERIEGHQVLAFLPAWDGRYYYEYPKYEPSPKLGGTNGFKKFVVKAHQLGVKVVPMLGANNANIETMKQMGLEDAILRGDWGEEFRCDWVDWDYDLAEEKNTMLANLGHPGFQRHMIERSSYLVDEFGVDGIFLDITFWWENDPRYSPYEGTVSWAKEMRRRYPELLLFGENSYDALWGIFSLFAESYSPPSYGGVLYRYARQGYYLACPEVGSGSAGIHEQAWNSPEGKTAFPQYVIPTMTILADTLTKYKKESEMLITQAREWQQELPEIAKK